MNEEYKIRSKKIANRNMAYNTEDVWSEIESLAVRNYMWNTHNAIEAVNLSDDGETIDPAKSVYQKNIYIPEHYLPEMHAKIFYTEDGLNIMMSTFEMFPKATYHKINDPVCLDSCQEFFIQPCPVQDSRYFNFEFNPWGVYLSGIGSNRYDRKLIGEEDDSKVFCIKNKIVKVIRDKDEVFQWSIEFTIPYDFITRYFTDFRPYSGRMMRGNFYKCGDNTLYPHFGSWNIVTGDIPDFHKSECFGTLVME